MATAELEFTISVPTFSNIASEFSKCVQVGMVGINVPIPIRMSMA